LDTFISTSSPRRTKSR